MASRMPAASWAGRTPRAARAADGGPPVAGEHEDGDGADGQAEEDVVRLVADHERRAEVEPELGRGPEPETGSRLGAGTAGQAGPVRSVGAGIDRVEGRAAAVELLAEAGVQLLELGGVEIAAAEPGLVGDDDGGEPGLFQKPDGFERGRVDVDLAEIGRIARVFVEGAVAVEEYGPALGHDLRSPVATTSARTAMRMICRAWPLRPRRTRS